MKQIEINYSLKREYEDVFVSKLYEYEIEGVSIFDDYLYFKQKENGPDWEIVDLPEHVSDKILVKVFFIVDDYNDFIKEQMTRYMAKNEDFEIEVVKEEILENMDWATEWMKFYKPLRIGKRLVIVPTWEEYDEKSDGLIIKMDPGMAFGTGEHPTTKMCIELLEEADIKDKRVLDIGCGSGILSIAAAKLGAGEVVATDIDEKCIESTSKNSANNQVKVKAILTDLTKGVEGKFDIIVMNIIAEVIISVSDKLYDLLADNGKIILSGILTEKKEMVVDAFTNIDFKLIENKEEKGWSALRFEKQNA